MEFLVYFLIICSIVILLAVVLCSTIQKVPKLNCNAYFDKYVPDTFVRSITQKILEQGFYEHISPVSDWVFHKHVFDLKISEIERILICGRDMNVQLYRLDKNIGA